MTSMEPRRWYKFKRDRMVAGVASGLAWSLKLHPAIVRGALLILTFGGLGLPQLSGMLAMAYIAAMFIVPDVPTDLEPEVMPVINGLVRPNKERLLAGVCLGIARYYKMDVSLVRVATTLLAFAGGVGIIAYAVAWLLMPGVGKEAEDA
jgi:phage shock protein PspC (stress-responsive transcriptional regulator)